MNKKKQSIFSNRIKSNKNEEKLVDDTLIMLELIRKHLDNHFNNVNELINETYDKAMEEGDISKEEGLNELINFMYSSLRSNLITIPSICYRKNIILLKNIFKRKNET